MAAKRCGSCYFSAQIGLYASNCAGRISVSCKDLREDAGHKAQEDAQMAIGMILFGILSGLAGVVWGVAAGFSVLAVIALYPLAGMVGALAFVALAMMAPTQRMPVAAMAQVAEVR